MKTKIRAGMLAAVTGAVLVACGGGGGGSDTPPPTPTSLTIAGTAAKGAALAGAAISVRCATGTASATTGGDGAYSVAISGAALPCAVRATGTEGSVFHAVVPGTGNSGTFAANVTPLSEMVVARVAGATPSSYFTAFSSASTVTAASVTQAIEYVRTALAGIADLGNFNPLTDTLVVGNTLDQRIDAVMAALASNGLTLADVSAAIVANPGAPGVVAAPLAPAATDCAWLKSGRYRVINPYETDPLWRAHVLTVDATARTARDQDNVTLNFSAAGACQYTLNDGEFTTRVLVSSASLLVMYSQSNTNSAQRSMAIGLPEQTLPLSEFAGTWLLAGWDRVSSPTPGFLAQTDEATFDGTGAITGQSSCLATAACTPGSAPFASFTANANGGFNLVEGGATTGRVFLFKTLAGNAAWVLVADDGQFIVGTRKETLGALPSVGSANHYREFALNGNGTIADLGNNNTTTIAVDAAANTITRRRGSDNRIDTISFDYPRTGLRYRALNSCTTNGVQSNCAQTVGMPLQGMGIGLSLSVGQSNSPTTAFYNVSVTLPTPN